MVEMIEIGGHTKSPLGKRLSNFQDRPFIFDGVRCGGFEGIVQALKCPDIKHQRVICSLSGREAKKAGLEFNSWKKNQNLFWNGDSYDRCSRGYIMLITRIYDELYEQDETLRQDLLNLGNAKIWHSIGKPDMRDTTLTEIEMLFQIERLRHRALREAITALVE